MNLDERLRDALHTYAAQAPDGRGLLAGVRRHVHRLDRRRNIAAAGAAGAVAAALVVAVPAALRSAQRPQISATQPSTAQDRLVPAEYQLAEVPFEPGWLPPGYDRNARVTAWSQGVQAAYYDKGNVLIARVQTTPQDFSWEGEDSQITINGAPARLRVAKLKEEPGRRVGLIFDLDGQRVEINGHDLDVTQVIRFAEELRPGHVRPSLGFRATLIPHGFVASGFMMAVVAGQPSSLCFHDAATVGDEVCIEVGYGVAPPRDEAGYAPRRPRWARLELGSGRVVSVTTNLPETSLSDEGLMRIARGVELVN